eukprot:g81991.t1
MDAERPRKRPRIQPAAPAESTTFVLNDGTKWRCAWRELQDLPRTCLLVAKGDYRTAAGEVKLDLIEGQDQPFLRRQVANYRAHALQALVATCERVAKLAERGMILPHAPWVGASSEAFALRALVQQSRRALGEQGPEATLAPHSPSCRLCCHWGSAWYKALDILGLAFPAYEHTARLYEEVTYWCRQGLTARGRVEVAGTECYWEPALCSLVWTVRATPDRASSGRHLPALCGELTRNPACHLRPKRELKEMKVQQLDYPYSKQEPGPYHGQSPLDAIADVRPAAAARPSAGPARLLRRAGPGPAAAIAVRRDTKSLRRGTGTSGQQAGALPGLWAGKKKSLGAIEDAQPEWDDVIHALVQETKRVARLLTRVIHERREGWRDAWRSSIILASLQILSAFEETPLYTTGRPQPDIEEWAPREFLRLQQQGLGFRYVVFVTRLYARLAGDGAPTSHRRAIVRGVPGAADSLPLRSCWYDGPQDPQHLRPQGDLERAVVIQPGGPYHNMAPLAAIKRLVTEAAALRKIAKLLERERIEWYEPFDTDLQLFVAGGCSDSWEFWADVGAYKDVLRGYRIY